MLFSRDECIYTNCYCEENIWKLCKKLQDSGKLQQLLDVYAVFISNDEKMIPIWEQRSVDKGKFVVWDYHVILFHQAEGADCQVYDLDTWLCFPTTFNNYVERAIRQDSQLMENFHRKFRVVPGSVFLETFASDRSHMKGSDGEWLKPPPSYPCISTPASANNLPDFVSMNPMLGVGDVMDLNSLVQRFYNG